MLILTSLLWFVKEKDIKQDLGGGECSTSTQGHVGVVTRHKCFWKKPRQRGQKRTNVKVA